MLAALGGAWPYAILSGVAYVLVAAWYVFVFNLIGVHAGVLVLLGRFTPKLWLSYTLGTSSASRAPSSAGALPAGGALPVLEQLGLLGVLGGLQLLLVVDVARRKWKLSDAEAFGLTPASPSPALLPSSSAASSSPKASSARCRGVRGLHRTRRRATLVDPVAEHQRADHGVLAVLPRDHLLAPLGVIPTVIDLDDGKVFLLAYFVVSAYFVEDDPFVLTMSPATAVGRHIRRRPDRLTKAAYGPTPMAAAAAAPAGAAKPKGGAAANAKPKAVAKPKSGGGGNLGNEIVDEPGSSTTKTWGRDGRAAPSGSPSSPWSSRRASRRTAGAPRSRCRSRRL